METDKGSADTMSRLTRWGKSILRNIRLYRVYRYFRTLLYRLQGDVTKRFCTARIDYKGISFRIHVPMRSGDFLTSIELYGCYEPMMIDRAIAVIDIGDVVFDVGCGHGYFSLFAAHLNRAPRKIFAIDEDWGRIKDFERNNVKFMDGRINSICCAIGRHAGGETQTLDSLRTSGLVPAPATVKMDIEGFELDAMMGMRNLLERDRPHLLIEVHPYLIRLANKNWLEEFKSLLSSIDYLIEMCPNHRGEHRGKVEPWTPTTIDELLDFCAFLQDSEKWSFAMHLAPVPEC